MSEEQKGRRRVPEEEFAPPVGAPEGDPPPAEPVIDEPEALDDFGRFLLSLDAETRELLDVAELRSIYADQQKKAREEKRAATKKAVAARAKHHALVAEGLLPVEAIADQEWRDRMFGEKVHHTIDLPELGDIGIRIDQKVFYHGHGYWFNRAEFADIISMEYQAQQQELLFEGKDKRHWLRRRARGSMGFMRDEDGAVRVQ